MNVIVAGDFAPNHRLTKQIEERRFQEIFPEGFVGIIKSADYSLVNLESPIIEKDFKPIKKCGLNLGCSAYAADAIKYAGFTAVTMANNHILDYSTDGLNKSIECCKSIGLDVVGVGKNLKEAERILYVYKAGKKLAIINCCEHEFSIATDTTGGANPLNPIRQYYCIQEAKKHADFVLVIVHGGNEHYQLPSPRMQDTYRFFVDAGADAIVNHHQHCYSGYEVYNEKPIFYGLGNFCFDKEGTPSKMWSEGYMVEIDFKKNITFKLYPYCQYGDQASVVLLEENHFDKNIKSLNEIIKDEISLSKCIKEFYENSTNNIECIFLPFRNRLLNYIWRKIYPKIISDKSRMVVLAHLQCESHISRILYKLKK